MDEQEEEEFLKMIGLKGTVPILRFMNEKRKQNVFSDIDVRHTVYEDLLLEEFIVYKKMLLNAECF